MTDLFLKKDPDVDDPDATDEASDDLALDEEEELGNDGIDEDEDLE
jgi:hypothetical protein